MATAGRTPMIDSGRVIGRGFRVVGDNFLPFIAVALLLIGLPVRRCPVSDGRGVDGERAGAGPRFLLYWGTILVAGCSARCCRAFWCARPCSTSPTRRWRSASAR